MTGGRTALGRWQHEGDGMKLVEQHRIDRHDTRFAAIDAATFATKNLYNCGQLSQTPSLYP